MTFMCKKQYLVKIGMIFLFIGLLGVVLSFLSRDILTNLVVNMAQFTQIDRVHAYIDMSISTSLSYILVAVGIVLIILGIIRRYLITKKHQNFHE